MRMIITGASSGIGAALAHHYAAHGATTLGLVARRGDLLQKLAAELKCEVLTYSADVRDAAAMNAIATDFIARSGCPDVVIANAGISTGALTEHSQDTTVFEETMAINFMGMLHTFQPFISPMRTAGKGNLVGIASVAGYRGLPGAGAYCASKAAAISYLESLRVEVKRSGVKVVTICPGYINTPLVAANPYSMPFIISAKQAANKIAGVIASGKSYAVIPWQVAIGARLLRLVPNWLFDRALRNAKRKPRREV